MDYRTQLRRVNEPFKQVSPNHGKHLYSPSEFRAPVLWARVELEGLAAIVNSRTKVDMRAIRRYILMPIPQGINKWRIN
jgi:hypothetical protein